MSQARGNPENLVKWQNRKIASLTPIRSYPLVVNETTLQARHITELRTAIDALRTHMSMSAYSWQYSVTINDWITANPILEMRSALDQALGTPAGGYSAGLTQGQQVKAIHIQELRDRVLAAWSSGSSTQINWLVTDHLGTPRMVFDQTGSLATVSRHDYLPFGEEIYAGTGGRTSAQGYTLSDNVRQKFTLKERDIETGLDYFLARYYSPTQGRFTSPDDILNDAYASEPASWNLYTYVRSNPLRFVDPLGQTIENTTDSNLSRLTDEQLEAIAADQRKKSGLNSIAFKGGKVTYDPNEKAKGGSATFRQALIGAINDPKHIFQLSDASNTSVNFMLTDAGTTTSSATGVEGPTTYQIGIDFADYASAANLSDADAAEAYSLGTGLYHEVNHKVSYDMYDPIFATTRPDLSPNNGLLAGVIDNENRVNRELGLPERRDRHSAPKIPGIRLGAQMRFVDASGRDRFIRWRLQAGQ